MDNQALINKITTTELSAGGLMLPEQFDRFVDLTIDESVMLKMVRVERRSKPRGEIDKLNIGQPVTESATENADTGNVYNPTFSKVEYTVKKVRSAFDLSTEALRENIEGENFRETLMNSFAKRIATDLELLAIQGDTVKYANDNTPLGRLLKRLDGWYVQTNTGCNYVDAGGAPVSKELFSKMIKALPTKYRQAYGDLRFFVSPTVYQDFVDTLSDRATALGDAALSGATPVTVYGIPVIPVPMIPENLGPNQNQTFIWLTFPKNFIMVIFREITVHWEFRPRKDAWENTTYTQVDFIIEDKEAIVRADNVGLA